MTREEEDRIIRRDNLLAAQEMFRVAGAGGPLPSPLGDAAPGRYGVPQYAAQDVPPVNIGTMPGLTLAQGQPQTTNLMNISSRLAPRHLIQRRRFG